MTLFENFLSLYQQWSEHQLNDQLNDLLFNGSLTALVVKFFYRYLSVLLKQWYSSDYMGEQFHFVEEQSDLDRSDHAKKWLHTTHCCWSGIQLSQDFDLRTSYHLWHWVYTLTTWPCCLASLLVNCKYFFVLFSKKVTCPEVLHEDVIVVKGRLVLVQEESKIQRPETCRIVTGSTGEKVWFYKNY